MSLLDQQIGHARRRLLSNVLLHRLCLGVLAAATLWTLTILVVRLFALRVPLGHACWIAASLAALFTLVATWLRRPTHLQAAVALDAAAGLKERLSTAFLVRRDGDPFVRAAVTDAERSAGRLHVPTHIRLQAPALWPWSAATVIAALVLLWFMPTVDVLAAEKKKTEVVPRPVVETEQRAIKSDFEEKLKSIKELTKDNKKLAEELGRIEPLEMPEQPTVTPADVRREAMRKIDDVRDKLQQNLQSSEEDSLRQTKRMFQQLNQPGNPPANDKLSQSLASGDFEGAKQALKQMADDIADAAKNAEDPGAKEKLEEMRQQLERLADQVSKLNDSVRIQKELENKGGLSEEDAKKLAEQLSKMDPKQLEKELQKQLGDKGVSQKQLQEIAKKIQQNQQAQQQCKQMSQALSKAAQACQKCQSPGNSGSGSSQAANALADAASQLSNLEMTEQMTKELQAQLSDLDKMREKVGEGDYSADKWRDGQCEGKIGEQGPNMGLGIGSKVGKEKTAYTPKPVKAKSRYQGGAVIGRMLVEGPQVRGEATAAERAAVESEVRDALDAVEREDVPRQYQKALREYFERLAGLVGQPAAEDPAKSDKPKDDGKGAGDAGKDGGGEKEGGNG